MKVLIQHFHRPGDISGVVTYCETVREMLLPHGVDVRVFSTASVGWSGLWRAVAGVDLVHLNSNHVRLVLIARLQRKPILIRYHYPFWDELTEKPHEPLKLWRRLCRDMAFNWRNSRGDGRGWSRWRFNASRFGRALLRIAVARAVNLRLGCSDFVARSTDLPVAVEVDDNPVPFPPPAVDGGGDLPTIPIFVFAGRLHDHKGVDLLLTATAALVKKGRTVHVMVAGSGPSEAELRDQAARLGLGEVVTFLGALSRERLVEVIAGALAVVVPSRRNEPAPYAILEATALGRCCIGSRGGGIPDLLGPHGLLFDFEDVDTLVHHMEFVISAPGEAAIRGREACAALRARCDYPAAARRLLSFYHRLRPDLAVEIDVPVNQLVLTENVSAAAARAAK